jgi:hypothetical protein
MMQAIELPPLGQPNGPNRDRIKCWNRRTLRAVSKAFAFLYLVLLTYLVITVADGVGAENDDMLLFLGVRVCAYWVVVIFLFFALNFSFFGISLGAARQYLGELYRNILPFWGRPQARSLHELPILFSSTVNPVFLEGQGVQVEALKMTQAILATDKWTEDCQACLEEFCVLEMPVTILVPEPAVLDKIKERFVPEKDDHVVVALDKGLVRTKECGQDIAVALASKARLQCMCFGRHKPLHARDASFGGYARVFLLDSKARIAWHGHPNQRVDDMCKWHSLPDEIRYGKYINANTVDETKWDSKYMKWGILVLVLGILWVVFHAVWSFIGISSLVDISSSEEAKVDPTIWTVTYIDSASGLLLTIIPFVVVVVLLGFSALFLTVMLALALFFKLFYSIVPEIVEEEIVEVHGGDDTRGLLDGEESGGVGEGAGRMEDVLVQEGARARGKLERQKSVWYEAKTTRS